MMEYLRLGSGQEQGKAERDQQQSCRHLNHRLLPAGPCGWPLTRGWMFSHFSRFSSQEAVAAQAMRKDDQRQLVRRIGCQRRSGNQVHALRGGSVVRTPVSDSEPLLALCAAAEAAETAAGTTHVQRKACGTHCVHCRGAHICYPPCTGAPTWRMEERLACTLPRAVFSPTSICAMHCQANCELGH